MLDRVRRPPTIKDDFPDLASGKESEHVDTPVPVLGVDASVAKAGFCLIHHNRIVTWKHEIKIGPGVHRLAAWRDYFSRLTFARDILHVVMEGYSFASKNSQAHSTGEIGGIYKLKCYDRGINLLLASPGTVKKFATGTGKGPKSAITLGLYKKYALELTDEDQADAAALALIGQAYWTSDKSKLLKYQQEAMKGVEICLP